MKYEDHHHLQEFFFFDSVEGKILSENQNLLCALPKGFSLHKTNSGRHRIRKYTNNTR